MIKVREMMTPHVLTVTTSQPASEAWMQMRSEGVRHAIVMLQGEPVGVLSKRDLGGTLGGLVRRARTVAQLMHIGFVKIEPDAPVAEAARMMRAQRIGCLPVMENGRLVGIVTRSDLLRVLAEKRRADRARPSATPNAIESAKCDFAPHMEHPVSPNLDKWP